MGHVIVTEFISLDGVIEDPGGAEKGKTGFPYGGWTFDFDRGKEGDEFKVKELRAAAARAANLRIFYRALTVTRT